MNDNVISLESRRTNILFENRYSITPSLLRQFQLVYLCSQPKILVLCVLFLCMLLLGVSALLFYPAAKWYTLTVLLGGPVLWVLAIANKVYYSGRKMEGRARILNSEKAPEAVVLVGEEFTVHNPAVLEVQRIRFDKVVRLLNTRNLYVLMLKPGVAILVKRHAFTKGTDEDFKRLVHEKCVNAKGRLY